MGRRRHGGGSGGVGGAFAPVPGRLTDITEAALAGDEEEDGNAGSSDEEAEVEDDDDSVSRLRVGDGSGDEGEGGDGGVGSGRPAVRLPAAHGGYHHHDDLMITNDDLRASYSPVATEPLFLPPPAVAAGGGGGLLLPHLPPTLPRQPTPVFHSESHTYEAASGSGAAGVKPTTGSGGGGGGIRRGQSDGSAGSQGGLETPLDDDGNGGGGGGGGASSGGGAYSAPYARQLSEDIYSPKHLKWEGSAPKDAAEIAADDDFRYGGGAAGTRAAAAGSATATTTTTTSANAAVPARALHATGGGGVGLLLHRPPPAGPIAPSLSQRMAQFRVGGVASHTLAITHSSSGEDGEGDGSGGGGGSGSGGSPRRDVSALLRPRPLIPGLAMVGSSSGAEIEAADSEELRATLSSQGGVGGGGGGGGATALGASTPSPTPPRRARRRGTPPPTAALLPPLAVAAASALGDDEEAQHRRQQQHARARGQLKLPWLARIFRRSGTHPAAGGRPHSPLGGSPELPHSLVQPRPAKPHARVSFPSDTAALETVIAPTSLPPEQQQPQKPPPLSLEGSGHNMHGRLITPGPASTGVGAGGGTEVHPAAFAPGGRVPSDKELLALAGPITRHDLEQPVLVVVGAGGGGGGMEQRVAAPAPTAMTAPHASAPERTSGTGYELLGGGAGSGGDDSVRRVPSARGVSPLCAACLRLLRIA